jgi:hypothetical protein
MYCSRSGSGTPSLFDSWIRIRANFFPDLWIHPIEFSEVNKKFGLKILLIKLNFQIFEIYGYEEVIQLIYFFIVGSRRGKNQNPGSGINIPNQQHCREVDN